MKQEVVITARLTLRTIKEEDAKRIVELRNKKQIYQFFKNPCPIRIEEHQKWYKEVYNKDKSRYDFAILLNEENHKMIGTCGISKLNTNTGSMEISYLMDDKYQGSHYASEAVTALIDMAKSRWAVRNVRAVIHQDNIASICFIQSLGFKQLKREKAFLVYQQET